MLKLARSYAVLLLALALLTACPAGNIKQSIDTGYKTADIYVLQTTQLLDAGAITSAQAQQRIDMMKQAKVALDAAAASTAQCSSTVTTPAACNDAQTAYNAANALLQSTLTWLIQHGKTGK